MTQILNQRERVGRKKPVVFLDIEVYPNVFLVGVKRAADGRVVIFEQSDRAQIDLDRLSTILDSHTIVTFNGMSYDMPVLAYALREVYEPAHDVLTDGGSLSELDAMIDPGDDGSEASAPPSRGTYRRRTCTEIKEISNRIINERVKYWEADRITGARVPRRWDHVDLIEPQPNPFASLKILNGRMHGRWMQDLPYHHEDLLTHEQIDMLRAYLHNDLAATESLWAELAEPMALREAMGESIGIDLLSKSDTQMGIAIIKHRVERELGRRLPRASGSRSQTFGYEPPAYLRFETPALKERLARIREHVFQTDPKTGKVGLPDFIAEPIVIGGTTYAMGIGGLHSTEANRAVRADETHVLVDADVASYYPRIILSLGLVPAAIGPIFLKVFEAILDDRLAAKARQKDIKLKMSAEECSEIAALAVELALQQAIDGGLKISANGTFGSLGSPFSIIFAPHLMIAVTLTGQLALLMLIEWAERAGIEVVSANTDGVLFRCPCPMFAGLDKDRLRPSALAEITGRWERETQFSLEFVEYRAIYSQNVNSYIALKAKGGHKRKGPLANPWSSHPDDKNARAALMKNPQTTICSDAALAFVRDGTPIEQTVLACRDVRQFVTVIKVTKGATWRGEYLGKVVRYYYGHDGEPILEAAANPETGVFKKVPETDGCRPLMTFKPASDGDLPWAMPDDIDYARYFREARKILSEIGAMGAQVAPARLGRLNPVKVARLLELLTI